MVAYKLTYHNDDDPEFPMDNFNPYDYMRGMFYSQNTTQHEDLTRRMSNHTRLGVKNCSNEHLPIKGLDISDMTCIDRDTFNLSGQSISQKYTQLVFRVDDCATIAPNSQTCKNFTEIIKPEHFHVDYLVISRDFNPQKDCLNCTEELEE